MTASTCKHAYNSIWNSVSVSFKFSFIFIYLNKIGSIGFCCHIPSLQCSNLLLSTRVHFCVLGYSLSESIFCLFVSVFYFVFVFLLLVLFVIVRYLRKHQYIKIYSHYQNFCPNLFSLFLPSLILFNFSSLWNSKSFSLIWGLFLTFASPKLENYFYLAISTQQFNIYYPHVVCNV